MWVYLIFGAARPILHFTDVRIVCVWVKVGEVQIKQTQIDG